MGVNENRVKAQKNAEDMKRRGVVRKTGQCPWGCGGTYRVTPGGGALSGGGGLMDHLNRCQGGGAKKRNRLTSVVVRMGKRAKR